MEAARFSIGTKEKPPMIDFEQEWRRQMINERPPSTPERWNARARKDASSFGPGTSYSDAFLDRAQLLAGETILDMGCGAGSLAIPAAERGHRVLACDFSEVMLEHLEQQLSEGTRPLVATHRLAWEDDWDAVGIGPNAVDVAFSSRSIATPDLAGALTKLTRVARRKVCLTISPGPLPRAFSALFLDLGLEVPRNQDAALVLGALLARGQKPSVGYIESPRIERFASFDEAVETYRAMIDMAVDPPVGEDRKRVERELVRWLESHLMHEGAPADEDPDTKATAKERPYWVDVPRSFDWMFISWETGN
jgi:SAM-dependent methyltransferase